MQLVVQERNKIATYVSVHLWELEPYRDNGRATGIGESGAGIEINTEY